MSENEYENFLCEDARAETQLFKLLYPGLRALAMKWIQHTDEAEELVSDSIMVYFKHRRNYKTYSYFRSSLYLAVRYKCGTYLRNRKRSSKRLQHILNFFSMAEEIPVVPFLQLDILALVRKHCAELSDKRQQVIMLTHFKGMNLKEAAMAMGIDHRAARKLHHYAMKDLKIRLIRDGISEDVIPFIIWYILIQ